MLTNSLSAPSRIRTFVFAAATMLCAALGALAQESKPGAPPAAPSKPAANDDTAPQVYVLISTTKGDIACELYRSHAPISVANFLEYADKGFYDRTIFHRVISAFMIQCGGYTADAQPKQGLGPQIKNEWQNGLSNRRGTLAMARLGGSADSATSQFFINCVDNAFLDEPRDGAGYAVFGQVIAGMKVVDAIRSVPTGSKAGLNDVPLEPIEINSVKRLTRQEAEKLAAADKAPPPAVPGATPGH